MRLLGPTQQPAVEKPIVALSSLDRYGTENDPIVAEQMNNLPKVVFLSTNVGAIGLRQQL
jgi:hypothetical protein